MKYSWFVSLGKWWGLDLIVRLFSSMSCSLFMVILAKKKWGKFPLVSRKLLFLYFRLMSHNLKVNDVCCFVFLTVRHLKSLIKLWRTSNVSCTAPSPMTVYFLFMECSLFRHNGSLNLTTTERISWVFLCCVSWSWNNYSILCASYTQNKLTQKGKR